MSLLRKIQRNVERDDEVPLDHQKLPVGKVVSSPVKGDFLALPIFAWVARRAKTQVPLVMITVVLVGTDGSPSPRGTLQIELPIYEDTELAVLAYLERFGWDGRVWPLDEGWPSGETSEEAALKGLMDQAQLKATFTFPPGEKGVALQPVTVSRARGPFLMPPLPAPEVETDPVKLQKLRDICAQPQMLAS
jgi:hypothetical protein